MEHSGKNWTVTEVILRFVEKVSPEAELKYWTQEIQYFSRRTLVSKIKELAPMSMRAMTVIGLTNFEVKIFIGKWGQ